jgi:hypothetical protein
MSIEDGGRTDSVHTEDARLDEIVAEVVGATRDQPIEIAARILRHIIIDAGYNRPDSWYHHTIAAGRHVCAQAAS